jgi:TonB family protein
MQPTDELGGLFAPIQASKPWYVNLFENLKEMATAKEQAPLQVTFRPMSHEELLNSEDPSLRQLAELQEERSFFASLSGNLASLFRSDNQPPLQLTSRPLTEEEMRQTSTMRDLEETSLPWYRTLFQNLKDTLFPPKLPPLELTSRPVQVKELFGRDEYRSRSQMMSVLVHVGVVALAFLVGTNKTVQNAVKSSMTLVQPPDIDPYMPKMQVKKQAMGGGGGGGDRSPLPASKGKLPRPDLKQFTPPMAVVNNPAPRLVMEPTIIAPPDAVLPNVNMPNYGDPFAKAGGPPSNGPGSGGGIGSGSGGGVGSGKGGGFGPGEGGGFGGGAFRIGGGVSAPVPIFKVEPEYSEEARKAKFQGTVLLAIVVDESGKTTNVRVVRALGMGLDEKAIEAVMKWRFRPGYKDGKAVPVMANVEVNFRLL